MPEPSRAPRSRVERPAPDWDQVLRRNYLERLKRERPPIHVRAELPGLIARGYEDIPEEDMVRLHWWGVAHDKPKTGTFMVRIKVTGGLVTPSQLRGLGRIARTYGRNEVELTTRQGVQFHWVRTEQLPEVLAEVEAIGLRTAAAEGDTIRNITGCPVAGIGRDELFDTTPVLRSLAEFFDSDFHGPGRYTNLPRKHKYTIAACPAQCNAPEVADVALVGLLREGVPGFALRLGGGMANTPRISRDLGVFVPASDTVDVLRAVTDVWQQDLRYRMSRARARIKFMVDDYGADGMRRLVEAQLGRALLNGEAPQAEGSADHMGVQVQREDSLVHVGVPISSGRLSGSTLEGLADLVSEFDGDVRLTRQQNLIIGNVPIDRADTVADMLRQLGVPATVSGAFARSVACTSQRFCNYSVAATKDKLEDILVQLVERFGSHAIDDLGVHLDGCPHACAQHWIGEIGLQGTTTHTGQGGERVEAYDLSVGGGLGARTAVGRRLLRRVPGTEVAGVIERLVGAWLGERVDRPGPYTLGDFLRAHDDEDLIAIAVGRTERVGPSSTRGISVRVPAPLQELVGGSDELAVEAADVGGALAALSEDSRASLPR